MAKKTILVSGDVSLDINIYKGEKTTPAQPGIGTVIKNVPGGASLLFKIISTINKKCPNNGYEVTFGYKEALLRQTSRYPEDLTSYATWQQTTLPGQFMAKDTAWKVMEPLGFGDETGKRKTSRGLEGYLDTGSPLPSILVIDDGAGYFRNREELWEHLLDHHHDYEHIVLKMASPVAKGRLFRRLTKEFDSRLVLITALNEIRKEPVLISKGISWEQTALDLIYELTQNPTLQPLLDTTHLLITLQSEGALYLNIDNRKIVKARLVFDPETQEGEWDERHGLKGSVIGLMCCFTAGIVTELMLEKKPNFDFAMTRGLAAQRQYKITGHLPVKRAFPYEIIGKQIRKPKSDWFSTAIVPIPGNVAQSGSQARGLDFKSAHWSILEGNYLLENATSPLYDAALRLAVFGEKELSNAPRLKVNHFLTYDRSEIESLRNLNLLMTDYLENDPGKKPLSLAVFGAPGAGKSFAVKQLAMSLPAGQTHGTQKRPFLEFNLSQFEDVNELIGAFHQIRDAVLQGIPPVIFWDEFDSQSYRWLQYLLAPLQDGRFQEGQITHPIGKCIFIFAGGTSFLFQNFGTVPEEPKDQYEKTMQEFKLKKVPDFKSRLSGYLNVLGPNPIEEANPCGSLKNRPDIFFPIRRALFIRTILGKTGNDRLDADWGLVNALLKIGKYTHGSRSFEKVLSCLKQKNSDRIQRSFLPPFNILSMHVEPYEDFITLMDERQDVSYKAFRIAREIHTNWMDLGDNNNWKLEYHKPYNFIPSHLKAENIAAAARIPVILAKAGLKAVPKERADFHEPVDFNRLLEDKPDLLTELAKAEHEGWVDFKDKQKWKFSPDRNDDKKLHNCMIPWEKLPDKEKDKDRDAIKNYSSVLDKAGLIIVKKGE